MKRLIWLPSARQVWFDVAARHDEANIATPVVWLGDDSHLESAKKRFPNARVFSLRFMSRNDRTVPYAPPSSLGAQILANPEWRVFRDQAIKLMNRSDDQGSLSLLEREAWLAELVLWSCALIEETAPDVLVTCEPPHSPPMHILHGVAAALGVQVLCFVSWPLVPGLMLRDGVGGADRPSPALSIHTSFTQDAEAEIDAYLSQFEIQGYAFEPRYMKLQAEAEVETLALAGKTIATKMAHWLQLNSLRHQRIIKKRNRMRESQRILLQKALSAAATDIPDNPYVYFPLQYEPERTTNPDGGAFHDQLHTLMILRGFLPDNLSIAVKEHPSQFNASMKGHRGRHPRFYDALRRIKGLHLLPASASSAELLRGCEAVATITGTAGLEGAALGKRSLIFGDAWFRGAPNTVSFTPNLRWADFEATPIVERAELRAWIVSKLRAFVIPGTSGPSNESYFSNWYTDGTLATAENEALYTALEEALTE